MSQADTPSLQTPRVSSHPECPFQALGQVALLVGGGGWCHMRGTGRVSGPSEAGTEFLWGSSKDGADLGSAMMGAVGGRGEALTRVNS